MHEDDADSAPGTVGAFDHHHAAIANEDDADSDDAAFGTSAPPSAQATMQEADPSVPSVANPGVQPSAGSGPPQLTPLALQGTTSAAVKSPLASGTTAVAQAAASGDGDDDGDGGAQFGVGDEDD